MRKRNFVAVWLAAALAAQSAWAGFAVTDDPSGRVIIQLQRGVSMQEGRAMARSHGMEVLDEISGQALILARPQAAQRKTATASLALEPMILDVQPDFWTRWIEASPVSFQQTPMPVLEAVREQMSAFKPRGVAQGAADPAADEIKWGVQRVGAPAAWPTNQGEGVKVAVVDTGSDSEHPDLKGRVAGGFNAVDKEKSWADDHGHGTHVSGIIAAELDGKGVVGVAPKARIYGVKVLTKEGSGSSWGIISGIDWCVENKMQVINMSLGSPRSSPFIERAVRKAIEAGVTVVAAAGNDSGSVNFPAAYDGVIAVSALDQDDTIAKFSSRGPQVAFIAPGVKVPSTVPYFHSPDGYKAYSGTSMASPHVAGLAVLAVARGAQGPEAVRSALTSAAQKLPGLSDTEQGAGVIDATKLAR
jgi:subtilisin family serine protease